MFSDPLKNVDQFHLNVGDAVVDFGSGAGHYALAAMRAVGSEGKVYSVDLNKDLLVRLKNEAKRQGFDNVEVMWGDIDKAGGTHLKDGVADAVFMTNILFQLESKETAFAEAKRLLKPQGRLMVVDWAESFGNMGPHPELVVTKDTAAAIAGNFGFTQTGEIDAGAHHYGIIFTKHV